MSGATAGHVLRASAATTAAFAQVQHTDLGGVTADQHHAQAHSLDSHATGKLVLPDGSDLTIAAGAITVTNSKHRLIPEGHAATDDLDTINGGVEGMILLLGTKDSAEDVVVKHNTGNILLNGGADFTLASNWHILSLIAWGGKWVEVARGTAQ